MSKVFWLIGLMILVFYSCTKEENAQSMVPPDYTNFIKADFDVLSYQPVDIGMQWNYEYSDGRQEKRWLEINNHSGQLMSGGPNFIDSSMVTIKTEVDGALDSMLIKKDTTTVTLHEFFILQPNKENSSYYQYNGATLLNTQFKDGNALFSLEGYRLYENQYSHIYGVYWLQDTLDVFRVGGKTYFDVLQIHVTDYSYLLANHREDLALFFGGFSPLNKEERRARISDIDHVNQYYYARDIGMVYYTDTLGVEKYLTSFSRQF